MKPIFPQYILPSQRRTESSGPGGKGTTLSPCMVPQSASIVAADDQRWARASANWRAKDDANMSERQYDASFSHAHLQIVAPVPGLQEVYDEGSATRAAAVAGRHDRTVSADFVGFFVLLLCCYLWLRSRRVARPGRDRKGRLRPGGGRTRRVIITTIMYDMTA
jgi:hypothetical protein